MSSTSLSPPTKEPCFEQPPRLPAVRPSDGHHCLVDRLAVERRGDGRLLREEAMEMPDHDHRHGHHHHGPAYINDNDGTRLHHHRASVIYDSPDRTIHDHIINPPCNDVDCAWHNHDWTFPPLDLYYGNPVY